MNIELPELIALIRGSASAQPALSSNCKAEALDLGQQIVVLDRGFVYVGNVEIKGEFVHIENAKNIRYWGTKNGLGELRDGPLKETKLDEIGVVIAPMRAVIHFVPAKGF